MSTELSDLLDIARQAARLSGERLTREQWSEKGSFSEKGRDIKLHADVASEEWIIDFLRKESAFDILSEEKGSIRGVSNSSESSFQWILDPLDGSFNFSRNVPLSCISIGLFKAGKPCIGVVLDLNRGEEFSAAVGEGAWLNDVAIRTSDERRISSSVLATGCPISLDFSDDALARYVLKFRRYKKIRMLGSAALSLSWVACGRFDVYMEDSIKVWDVAAGLALVEAAGGIVQYSGWPESERLNVTAAATPEILGSQS